MAKADVQKEFRKQTAVFVEEGMDFLLCEYFEHIEEMEWAIEECLTTSLPVAASSSSVPISPPSLLLLPLFLLLLLLTPFPGGRLHVHRP